MILKKIFIILIQIFQKQKKYFRILRGVEVYFPIDIKIKKELIGNIKAQWCVATEYLSSNIIIYSFGVGTDISFDLSLANNFRCDVYAFDPTPRSIEWMKKQKLPSNFVFCEYGVAAEDGEILFYPPLNSNHVSFSINNANDSSKGLRLPVYRLASIMKMLGHRKIDILKMDIEGSEYGVIQDIIESNISITQIMVEFHHRFDDTNVRKTKRAISSLQGIGYKIFYISATGEEYSLIMDPYTKIH
jgi:FkbM family methyltransferase